MLLLMTVWQVEEALPVKHMDCICSGYFWAMIQNGGLFCSVLFSSVPNGKDKDINEKTPMLF